MKESYKNQFERPSGGRIYSRPDKVMVCKICRAPVGQNYKRCEKCYRAIEDLWTLDWEAFLDKENVSKASNDEGLLAQIVVEDLDAHPWTIVDSAMKLISCGTCGSELGGGPISCP